MGMLRPREACGVVQGSQAGQATRVHPDGKQEGESELSKGVKGREGTVESRGRRMGGVGQRRKRLVAVVGMLLLWKMGEAWNGHGGLLQLAPR